MSEVRLRDAGKRGWVFWVSAVPACVVILYLGFAAAVIIDELVLGTFWFSDHIPEALEPVVQTIYRPLSWLVEQMDV